MNNLNALIHLKEQLKLKNLSKSTGIPIPTLKAYLTRKTNPSDYRKELIDNRVKEIIRDTKKLF